MIQIIVNISSLSNEETCASPSETQQQMAYIEYSRAVFEIRRKLHNHQEKDTHTDDEAE